MPIKVFNRIKILRHQTTETEEIAEIISHRSLCHTIGDREESLIANRRSNLSTRDLVHKVNGVTKII